MLYIFALFWDLKTSLESSLRAFNFGIKIAQRVIADKNNITSSLFEISALENPPVRISVIEYAFDGFVSIKKDIMELANKFTDKPIKISFVMENFEKPLNAITSTAAINAPKNPNKE